MHTPFSLKITICFQKYFQKCVVMKEMAAACNLKPGLRSQSKLSHHWQIQEVQIN